MTTLLKRIWEAVADKENTWFPFLIFGCLLSFGAFVGEIPKTGIKIQGSSYQPLLLACGALLLLTAVGLAIHRSLRPPILTPIQTEPTGRGPKITVRINAKAVGMVIDKPRQDEQLASPIVLSGTVSKPPPQDWLIFLVGVGARDRRPTYWPYKEVKILKNQRNWSIEYKSGPGPKVLQLYLVGKDGQALMNAFYDINGEHLSKSPGSYEPLRALTSDMVPACDELRVSIAEPKA